MVDWQPARRRRSDAGRSDCVRTNGRPTAAVAAGVVRLERRPLEMRAADDEAHVDRALIRTADRSDPETVVHLDKYWPFGSHSTAPDRPADGMADLVLARQPAPFC